MQRLLIFNYISQLINTVRTYYLSNTRQLTPFQLLEEDLPPQTSIWTACYALSCAILNCQKWKQFHFTNTIPKFFNWLTRVTWICTVFLKAAMRFIWKWIYVSMSISLTIPVYQKFAGCLVFAFTLEYNISRPVIQ